MRVKRNSEWADAMKFAGMVRHKMPQDFFDFLSCGRMSLDLRVTAVKDPRFRANPLIPSGVRLMWRTFDRYDSYYSSIPNQCHALLGVVQQKFTHRRKDTLRNILYVAEAVIHRASYEKETRILFSYESLRLWIKLSKNYLIGYHTLKTALTYLNDSEFFTVKFGAKGNLVSCTRITLHLNFLDQSSEEVVQDWVSELDWVMGKIIDRELDIHDQRVLLSSQDSDNLYDTQRFS